MPKAELHLHIEGSLEPELMFDLAQKNEVSIGFESVEQIREAYRFADLQEFLDIYYSGMQVLLTESDFDALTWAYILNCRANNIIHCELFFDPQAHLERGVAFSTVVHGICGALSRAEREFNISSRLIMCFLRHLDEESAFDTLNEAMPHLDLIHAVGLDSSELGHPPSKFKRVFASAAALGLRRVAHAGEEGPAAYVVEALDSLKVERIDHGNRALEDPALVERLIEEQIPLTVCPCSNLALQVVKDLSLHPLKRMLDLNLLATVNSDDPAYFGGYLNENYLQVAQALQLTDQQIVTLARNSFQAAFLSDEQKRRYISLVDAA